ITITRGNLLDMRLGPLADSCAEGQESSLLLKELKTIIVSELECVGACNILPLHDRKPNEWEEFWVAIFIISPIGPCIYKKEPLVATNEPKHYITDRLLAIYS
ncbi:hypothetical protein ACJX0J_019114, partial [Zea mays]